MAIEVILHIHNSDPVVGELDEMPDHRDTMIKVTNPRHRDGKDLQYLQDSVVTVLWPLHEISFIEILPSDTEDQIVGFVRE